MDVAVQEPPWPNRHRWFFCVPTSRSVSLRHPLVVASRCDKPIGRSVSLRPYQPNSVRYDIPYGYFMFQYEAISMHNGQLDKEERLLQQRQTPCASKPLLSN